MIPNVRPKFKISTSKPSASMIKSSQPLKPTSCASRCQVHNGTLSWRGRVMVEICGSPKYIQNKPWSKYQNRPKHNLNTKTSSWRMGTCKPNLFSSCWWKYTRWVDMPWALNLGFRRLHHSANFPRHFSNERTVSMVSMRMLRNWMPLADSCRLLPTLASTEDMFRK